MSDIEMDRAHREDYAYKNMCENTARMIDTVLEADRAPTGFHWQNTLREARALLWDEADHIVAVWD